MVNPCHAKNSFMVSILLMCIVCVHKKILYIIENIYIETYLHPLFLGLKISSWVICHRSFFQHAISELFLSVQATGYIDSKHVNHDMHMKVLVINRHMHMN